MEKYAPYINAFKNHHYWLVALIVFALPIIAWSNASETLKNRTNVRKTNINTAFSAASTSEGPNQNWTKNATDLNAANDTELKAAFGSLYASQADMITWPPSMAEYMTELEYRDKYDDIHMTRTYFGEEKNGYRSQFAPLLAKLDPYRPDPNTGRFRGKVLLDPESVFPYAEGSDRFGRSWRPSIQEMWDAQEDLAIVSDIVDVLAAMNSSAISIADAPLKRIQKIDLVGGEYSDMRDDAGFDNKGGSPDDDISSVTGGTRAEEIEREKELEKQQEQNKAEKRSEERKSGMGGPGAQAAGALGKNKASFKPKSQFGNPKVDPDKPGGRPTAKRVDRSRKPTKDTSQMGRREKEEYERELRERASQEKEAEVSEALAAPTTVGGKVPRAIERYIDNSKDLPYVTRGFYLELTIDHRKLPELIGDLTNMPLPTMLCKIHTVSLNHNSEKYIQQQTSRGQNNRAGGRGGFGRSRSDDDEDDTGAEKKPKAEARPKKKSLEEELLSDSYLADVAIAGYVAIFTLETEEAQAVLFPDKQKEAPSDTEEADKSEPAARTEEDEEDDR